MASRPINPGTLCEFKRDGQRIAALTAYDYTSAQICEAAGLPMVLVGDTLGMVVRGESSTLAVTLDDVIYHSRMVKRATSRTMVIADLPFMTYQVTAEEALRNAGRLMQEAGVAGVKVEGGAEIADTVARLVEAGIPVCAHLGYTPQATHALGGARVQGRTLKTARKLVDDAQALEQAGAFAVVLELVPNTVAGAITQQLDIPTIGIGAGPACDGEIQVFHDLLGLYTDFQPRHTRRFLQGAQLMTEAVEHFNQDVATRAFPGPEQSTDIKGEIRQEFAESMNRPESLAVD